MYWSIFLFEYKLLFHPLYALSWLSIMKLFEVKVILFVIYQLLDM